MDAKTVAVVSGGLDSVVLAHHLAAAGEDLLLLSVDYGQKALKEHEFAELAATRLNAPHEVVRIPAVSALVPGYSLTDAEVETPRRSFDNVRSKLPASMDHVGSFDATTVDWAAKPGAVDVLPNRNVLICTVAFMRAVTAGAQSVAVGMIAGSAVNTPDTSAEFVAAFNAMEREATKGYVPETLAIVAPFIGMSKPEVVVRGQELGVPMGETWSCYNGGPVQCGECGGCIARRSAFHLAKVSDPTVYRK
ncbi:7-cyano-7-deazaguanine synthase [Nonomuraea fuscirosea]|uniref:7-cyano-7-deazaguanine synthase n=1 Tax=Nonomuraea fuscirosea TaxID=1291556 RepID=UPI00343FF442